jgi:hypothetical protein
MYAQRLAGFDVYEKFQSSFVKRALVLLEKINMHHRGYITPSLIVIVDVIFMGGNGCAIDIAYYIQEAHRMVFKKDLYENRIIPRNSSYVGKSMQGMSVIKTLYS